MTTAMAENAHSDDWRDTEQLDRRDFGDHVLALEVEEKKLAQLLKDGSREDFEADARILKDMGNVYCERGRVTKDTDHFIKSAALLHADLMRTKESSLVDQLELFLLLKETESEFCKAVSVKPDKLPSDFRADIKGRLAELRTEFSERSQNLLKEMESNYSLDARDSERIEIEKDFNDKTQRLFADLSAAIIEFFRYLLSLSKEILGMPPQEYVAVALGSLARGETTPYSDVEWAILVEDDTKNMDYFKNLAKMVHLFVLNIQETLLKSLAIKSLNDYDTPGGNWFIDNVALRGFQFDSAAPYACNTPLGRPDRPTKEGRELIRTPQRMAQLCEYNTALKEGYNIDRIMTSIVQINGSSKAKKLLDEFTSARAQVKSSDDVKVKAFGEIQDLIGDFYPKMSFHKDAVVHDIKKDLFRLPTLVICLFKTLYSLNSNSTWEVLEEMGSADILTQEAVHNLKCVVSIVSLLRLSIYSEKKHQEESISLLCPSSHLNTTPGSNPVAHIQNHTLVFRCYYTIIPFTSALQENDNDAFLKKIKLRQTFYEHNEFVTGLVELHCCMFRQSRNHFASHIERMMEGNKFEGKADLRKITYEGRDITYCETDEKMRQCLVLIGNSYFFEDRLDETLFYENTVQSILERRGDHSSAFAYSLNRMACLYVAQGKSDMAFATILNSHDAWRHIHGDEDHDDMVLCLNNIGSTYLDLGKPDEALQYFMRSRDMKMKLNGQRDDLQIARSLANIGHAYKEKGEFDEALRYLLQALDMRLRLHGNGNHPDVSASLHNTAVVYTNLGNYDKALLHHKQALSMDRQLNNNQDHSSIAVSLTSLGTVYRKMKDFEQSEKFLKDALDMYKRLHSNGDHPHIAAALNNIGKLEEYKGQLETAEQIHQDALAMMNRCHNNRDHPDIAICLSNIGNVLSMRNDFVHALKYHKDSLEMRTRLRSNFSDIAKSLFDVGCIHDNMEHLKEALEFYLKALEVKRQAIGDKDGAFIVSCLDRAGVMYTRLGKNEEAKQSFIEALSMRKRMYGDGDHKDIAISLRNLAFAFLSLGDHMAYIQFLMQSLDMQKRLDGGHPASLAFMGDLGL